MAKNSIRDFDATSGNNTDIQSVDISEGCAASGINNAIRELMTDLKNVSTGAINLETPVADGLTIGTSNLDMNGNELILDADADTSITADTDDRIDIKVGGSDKLHVNSDGKLLFATTSSDTDDLIQIESPASGGGYGIQIRRNDNNTDQQVGSIKFGNTSDSDIVQIAAKTDGAANSGAVKFLTASSGTTSERMRIDAGGSLTMPGGDTSPQDNSSGNGVCLTSNGEIRAAVGYSQVADFNRMGNDGTVVMIRQAGTAEGSIEVNGSTVSLNGGHLSRWSQTTDGQRISGLLRGTVMTNLDQMAVWSHDEVLWTEDDELPDGVSVGDVRKAAYTEDNEQLNCMAVSSVEGDANVAGVFQGWDESDDFNDMTVAMTGDFIIRIAQGTTVAQGDLLMSAGDGTAKPQGDDIVRSKTIAKVTSTNVSHTYDDGSYLVPCVLMAC